MNKCGITFHDKMFAGKNVSEAEFQKGDRMMVNGRGNSSIYGNR